MLPRRPGRARYGKSTAILTPGRYPRIPTDGAPTARAAGASRAPRPPSAPVHGPGPAPLRASRHLGADLAERGLPGHPPDPPAQPGGRRPASGTPEADGVDALDPFPAEGGDLLPRLAHPGLEAFSPPLMRRRRSDGPFDSPSSPLRPPGRVDGVLGRRRQPVGRLVRGPGAARAGRLRRPVGRPAGKPDGNVCGMRPLPPARPGAPGPLATAGSGCGKVSVRSRAR